MSEELIVGGGLLAVIVPVISLLVKAMLVAFDRAAKGDTAGWQLAERHERQLKDLRAEQRLDRQHYEELLVAERVRFDGMISQRDQTIDDLQESERELRLELEILRRAQRRALPPPKKDGDSS